MNQLIYPYYLESTKKAKINKFINTNELTDAEVYDEAFDTLISFIDKYLRQYNQKKHTNEQTSDNTTSTLTPKVTKVSKGNIMTDNDDTIISASMELLDKPRYSYDQQLDTIDRLMIDDYEHDKEQGEGPIKFVQM